MGMQPTGGSASWCPDCGHTLVAGESVCSECGLDPQSRWARDAEAANRQLHEIARKLGELQEAEQRWIDYRNGVLAGAPRTRAEASAPDEPAMSAAPTAYQGPPSGATVFANPAAAPPSRSATEAASGVTEAASGATGAAGSGATTATRSGDASMRTARTLSAATLLGVAGAALVILAGIIFVAASWTDYGPVARMIVLIGFSAVFAWLGWLSHRNHFPTIGGSLAIVSATFAGVAVYAARTGPAGVEPFTFPVAVLVAAAVAVVLARVGLHAVGLASSGALALAVEAGAIEGAARTDGVVTALSVHSITGALGAVLVILAARAWTVPLHRAVAQNSGIAVAFLATATAVVAPYVAASPLLIVATQAVVALAVCAGVATWRPTVGAGALAFAVTWSAMGMVSMWSVPWGSVFLAGVAIGVGAVAALRRAPREWAVPGLIGLVPLAVAAGLVAVWLLFAVVAPSLFDLTGPGSLESMVSGWWASAAIMGASASFLLLDRWPRPLPVTAYRGLPVVGAGLGTVSLALLTVSYAPEPFGWVGVALTLAAIVQWFAAAWWHRDVRAVARHAAAIVATLGGLHGAGAVASVRWTEVAGDRALGWAAIGSILFAVVALAGAALRVPTTAGAGIALVLTAGASAVTWSLTHAAWDAALAAAVATVAVLAMARIVPRRIGEPMAWGAAPAAVVGAFAGALTVVAAIANLAFIDGLSVEGFDAFRGVAIAAAAVIVAPVAARLWSSGDADARGRVSAGIAGPALVAGAISGLAWLVEATGTGAVGVVAAASVGAAGAAFLVTLLRPWRSSRMVTIIAGATMVTASSLVVLGHVAAGSAGRSPALWSVAVAVAALAGVAWRYPRVALGQAITVGTLAIPAAVLPANAGWALWSAVVTATVGAWAVLLLTGERRRLARWGLLPVTVFASAIVPVVVWLSASTLARLHSGGIDYVNPMWWVAEAAAVAAALSLPPVRARAAWVMAPALLVMAGLVPAPFGWIGLAAAALMASEMAIRWRSRWGLHPAVGPVLGAAAVLWSSTARWSAAVSLGLLTASALWIAVRSHRVLQVTWSPALVVAPLAGTAAVWLTCVEWGLDAGHAAVIASGTAFAMPIAAVAARLDTQVAPVIVAMATVTGTIATMDLALAAMVVLLACAAWYGLSVLGMRWARWVALGGLSVATVLLLGSVGVETWEAYTAVPAGTLIGLGLWWMRKDTGKRSYEALAPGLGVALVPSYLALFAQPQTLARPLALVFAALVLAIVGVARRWFAPLLATALTAVVLAVGQIAAHDALVPKWVSFAFVGGVILALGLVAERISKMR
ncbi:hypothetical protein [Demequina sp.]|uniref:SCO7613 C-terminal domain-containing membrane protein n=1 Tax=Demequina sp. TaxID=2050685 RepID=UPI0025C285D4|nr:hypothetical protein [Demequina sp.]